MTDGQQRSIEIYALKPDASGLIAWIVGAVGEVQLVEEADGISIYRSSTGVAVTVTPGIEDGPFTSIMFAGGEAPWPTDANCARDAARTLGTVVRCVAKPDDESDEWLQIESGREGVVAWDTPV